MVPTSILTVAMAVAATTLSVVAAPINGDTSSAFSTGAFNKVPVGQVPSILGSLPRPFNLTTSEADSIRKRAGHTSTSSRLARRKLTAPKISSGDVTTGITAGSDIYEDFGGNLNLSNILLSHSVPLSSSTSSSNTDSRKQRDVNEAAQQIRSLLAIAKYVNSVQKRDESVADNSDFSLSGLEPILKDAGSVLGDLPSFNLSNIFRRDDDGTVVDNSDISLSGLKPILKDAGSVLGDLPSFNLSNIFRRDDDGTVADNSDISLSGLKPILKDAGSVLGDLPSFNLSSIFRRDDDETVADNSDISLSGLKPILKDAGSVLGDLPSFNLSSIFKRDSELVY